MFLLEDNVLWNSTLPIKKGICEIKHKTDLRRRDKKT